MVLISKSEYDMLTRDPRSPESSSETAVKVAEKKCEDILRADTYPDDDVKNAVFQDAMRSLLSKRKQTEKSLAKEEMGKKVNLIPSSSWESKICQAVPQRFKTRARSLWATLSSSPLSICLSDSGEVEISGSAIPSSNIIDLISRAVKDSASGREPVGWGQFLALLTQPDLNIPMTAVGKHLQEFLKGRTAEVEQPIKGRGAGFTWLRLRRRKYNV